MVSKVFEKLVNKCGLFSDFKYCFRSSQSTADLLRVISDRIARAFMRSGATRAVALNISKDFCRAWHAGLQQHNSYGMLVQIFGLVSSLFINRPVWSSQEYPVNAGIFQGLILGLALFLLYIDLYSKCDQASNRIDLWSWIWSMRHCWLVFFFYQFSNTCAVDVKMDGSVLEEKSSFKILGLTFSSKLDWGSYIISVAKSVSK